MVALWNRADHYIFALSFVLSFFPLLISDVAYWMYAILSHMVWPCVNLGCRSETCWTRLAENTGRKKSPKDRHLCTMAQLCQAISSQLRHILTTGNKPFKQQYLLHISHNMANLGSLAAEIDR